MRREDLISDAYLAEQVRLHAAPRGYGGRGDKWAKTVIKLAHQLEARTILDYGCGQGTLGRALLAAGLAIREYDPARPGFDRLPEPADLVICTDVMEHVEPECVERVVAHLAFLSRPALFVVVSLVPTAKTLSDGQQAHVTLRPAASWRAAFTGSFAVDREWSIKPTKQWVALLRRVQP